MAFLISPIRAICPAHLDVDAIVFVIKWCCASLCYFKAPYNYFLPLGFKRALPKLWGTLSWESQHFRLAFCRRQVPVLLGAAAEIAVCFASSVLPGSYRVTTFNPLALELDIYSLANHLCEMWIFYEPRRITSGNTRHFVERNKRRWWEKV